MNSTILWAFGLIETDVLTGTMYLQFLRYSLDSLVSNYESTAAISADYSAEVSFVSSAFGMPSNMIDSDNLTLCGHNNLCRGERLRSSIVPENVYWRCLIFS